jgi:hypothetical protein
MVDRLRPVLAAVALVGACASDASTTAPARPPPAAPAAPAAAAPPPPPAAPLGEADARALLAERFRAVGLRIRVDVADPSGVTLDGWDAARGLGYEYVATPEGDVAVDEAARAALGARVLVLDACDEATLRAAADRFLATSSP